MTEITKAIICRTTKTTSAIDDPNNNLMHVALNYYVVNTLLSQNDHGGDISADKPFGECS